MNRALWILTLFSILLGLLASCSGGGTATETAGIESGPAPSATQVLDTATVTRTAALSVTPSPVPATATAVGPSITATPVPPSPTPPVAASPAPSAAPPTGAPPTGAPTLEPPAATTTSTTTPTATPTLPPSATPAPPPSAAGDPSTVRVALQRVTGGLDTPVAITHAGDGSGRLFVVEKVGRIRVVQASVLLDQPYLDISDRVRSSESEQGLLGLAFHPDHARNGSFYVNYTNLQGNTVVARFAVGADPGRADPSSEAILLTVAQPAGNHNGGHLAFGPDGYLYIGLGDGGAANDRFGNGQNGATLLGAMLRLDVDSGQPYAIPADNPFLGDPTARDEIWAIGLRNPWRYSFDRQTGDLYIADVGQNRYEEVNVRPAGSPGGDNYGWPIMEGLHCFPEDQPCNQAGLILPVAEYDHGQGCSVTGGYVYRGTASQALSGIYLYGDYCTGRIWGLAPGGAGDWRVAELAQTDARISSFGEDEAGELYVLDMGRGDLFKIAGQTR